MTDQPEVRLCLYHYCGKWVTLIHEPAPPWGGQARKLEPQHDVEHHLLTGPCPMSLQPVGYERNQPAPLNVLTMLEDRARVDGSNVSGLLAEQVQREYNQTVNPSAVPESTTLRQPSRMGREPEPDAEEWQLGGREDEDSGHIQQYAAQLPKVPAHIAGQQIGRPVMAVSEIIASIQEISLRAGEGIATLQGVINSLEMTESSLSEALNGLAALQGQTTSTSLDTYTDILRASQRDVHALIQQAQNIIDGIGAGQDLGERYIGLLLS